MRIGFPERVPPGPAVLFAVGSFLVQQIQNTEIKFSALYFVFVILSIMAFNTAGGFSRIAGAYYFCFSVLVCIFGVTWKMVLAEPGETNLQNPDLTMLCYVVAAGTFLAVAYALKKIDLRHYEFGAGGLSAGLNYSTAGMGCMMVAIANQTAGSIFGIAPGGLLSALRQLDVFMPLGVLLATIGAINDSNGKRTMNFINGFGMLFLFGYGLTAFSKQGMLSPMVCWLLACIYKRFDLRRTHFMAIAIGAFLAFYVFSPLSQSRDLIKDDMGPLDKLVLGIDSMIHIQDIRKHVEGYGNGPPSHSYYNNVQNGLVQRFNMIGTDDALINYALEADTLGWEPVKNDFLNFIPHVLAPNKVQPLTGNFYAHEIGGMVADEDFGTGISFSPVAESFRIDHWIGLFCILPMVWLILFPTIEFICGDIKTSPWTLMPILVVTHVAPEGLLSGQIYLIGFGSAGFLLGIIIATRVSPMLGRLFFGSAAASTVVQERSGNIVRGSGRGQQPAPALP